MNAQMNVLWGEALGLILPDTTYYEEGNEKGPELTGYLAPNDGKTFT